MSMTTLQRNKLVLSAKPPLVNHCWLNLYGLLLNPVWSFHQDGFITVQCFYTGAQSFGRKTIQVKDVGVITCRFFWPVQNWLFWRTRFYSTLRSCTWGDQSVKDSVSRVGISGKIYQDPVWCRIYGLDLVWASVGIISLILSSVQFFIQCLSIYHQDYKVASDESSEGVDAGLWRRD